MPQVFSKNMNATARGSIVMELIDPKVIQLVTPPPDISGLSLEEQAAPAPWLAIRAHADVRVAVEKCIERNPARARTKSRRNWRWVELTLTRPWLRSSFWSEGRARRGPQSDGRNLLRGREGRGAKVVATLLDLHQASGGPGIEPRWTRSDKDGVGTAYSALSHVWFTVSKGILNEIYYPTIDRPQIRDLQYLITDGETFFSDERRLLNTHERLVPDALGFRVTNVDPAGRYRITKEIIADPHRDCLLMHTRLEAEAEMLAKLRLFALLAPHLESGGRGNFGNVVQTNWGKMLAAHKGATWLVLAASVPFLRCSCGYVGTTDGWQDLARDLRMDWEFDSAPDGNIALTGELDFRRSREFTLTIAFGESLHHAVVAAAQALGTPFTAHRTRFIEQWQREDVTCNHNWPAWRATAARSTTLAGTCYWRMKTRPTRAP